ncbi:MAG: UDP-N-acetylmuramoyl-L-alanine--D-glutamate ligase [Halothiobacillus sp. 28-55-5]|nr:MAG: UDP-N-acetylmuramoyl-L-alanine--D-glutamate ligase [Halothiobacillus sp. 28-55-5]
MSRHHLILGMGKSGQSVARHLARQGLAFAAADTRDDATLRLTWQQAFPQCPLCMGDLPEALLVDVASIIVSPGIALDHPFLKQARAQSIAIRGDIDLALHALTLPYVLITGANGKSTVTALVGALVQALGLKVAVGGNFGTPALDLFAESADVWVLEVSSFQLESTDFSPLHPTAATVLNISQDHLDRHGDVTTYAAIKETVLHRACVSVINRDDPLVRAMAHRAGGKILSFGADAPASAQEFGLIDDEGRVWLARGTQRIFPAAKLGIFGLHNQMNALAALALVAGVLEASGKASGRESFDLIDGRIAAVLSAFTGLPHRAQRVGMVAGVCFIDDSKATNVGAAVAAIAGQTAPLVLIAGGQGKGQDFTPLAQALSARGVGLVLMGQDQAQLAQAVKAQLPKLPIRYVNSMPGAVQAAAELAAPFAQASAVVLLAPACASLDMFASYVDRGLQFAAAVNALLPTLEVPS